MNSIYSAFLCGPLVFSVCLFFSPLIVLTPPLLQSKLPFLSSIQNAVSFLFFFSPLTILFFNRGRSRCTYLQSSINRTLFLCCIISVFSFFFLVELCSSNHSTLTFLLYSERCGSSIASSFLCLSGSFPPSLRRKKTLFKLLC